VSTREERTDIRVPKSSKIHHFLYVDTKGDSIPKWRLLDALLTKAEENSEDQAARIFDAFVSSIAAFYPEKKERIEKLRALILWHILEGEDLAEEYWRNLREL
jgi:transglutaminase-like putative cysteine protease